MACPDGKYFCNDRQKCMPIPKGHKVRKDGELVKEARTVRSKEDAEKARQQRDNPDEWVVRNKGGGHHGLNRKSALKGQSKRRSGNLKSISKKELEDHGKRNLYPDYKKTAKKALSIERARKKSQRVEAQSKSKETGKQHDVDHVQGQANRKKNPDRWHRIHPGDASDNRRVISQADNLKKNSKDSSEKKTTRASVIKRALDRARQNEEFVYEVAPPGWGHTKAEKEKTDPSKPKSKIGGTAAAFKRALDRGDFKGLPGSKTKKEKTSDMFKLMWSMKNKGDKPHYKPGTDEKYKKYQEEEYKDPVYYALQTDKKIMKLLDKDKKKKKKKYEESTSMKNVDPKDRKVIRARQKNLFKKDLTGEHVSVNEEEVKEGASIIRGNTSKKKVSYRGATADHKRDKDGNIEASYYGKKEKSKKHTDAVRKFDNYKKLQAEISAREDARKKHNQEYAASKRANEEVVYEKLSAKDAKKLDKASALSQSNDPKDQDRARARQTEIDYKDLLSQIKKKKVKVGKSMKEAAKDQSSKQLDRGMKTTQKAMGVIDNSPYGKLSDDKVDRMNKRLRDRRKDVSGEKISRLTKSLGEGKCDDCTCPGCGPNGVGHQNPCVKCGGHHKEKVNEKYGDTFDTPKYKRKRSEAEKKNKESNLRMKYGKKWREFSKDASSAKNRLRPGEVKKLVNGKWVSNKS